MLYELKIYVSKDVHYVKVTEEELKDFREGLDDDTSPNYIEVECVENESIFAIKRESVEAFEYKAVSE